MGDLISIKSRKGIERVANWRSFVPSESGHEECIAITQEAVWAIFQRVVTADNPEEAYKNLADALPTRRQLTYWLGQTGHRLDVRLGRDRGFHKYLAEVAARLWERSRNQCRE